ncbi:hypothetical protein [Roseateles puraquae]|uniref:Uncharacterized protein n=1 Tax=Roseateles puraquae TaxID=431059 RepID=A0A254NF52_9BURK|nr:hypothetical protein [Roseateles puraquae]MDG0854767.1 hypothetical protein [Roseateles puraquae]OWR04937.1 hypothetical protein CDO81_00100 [Roseateles puraquae]
MEVVAVLIGAAQFPDQFGPTIQVVVLSERPSLEGAMNSSARDPHQDHRMVWCPSAPVVQAILEGSPERQSEDGLVRTAPLVRGQQRHVRMPIHGVPAPGPQQRISPNGAYAHQRVDPVEEVVRLFAIDVVDVAPELGFGVGLHVASMLCRATRDEVFRHNASTTIAPLAARGA